MPFSFATLMLVAVFTLALFLSVLNYAYWRMRREDITPFWLAAWLAGSALFALCRLLQYAPLDEALYRVIPRVLLTACYSLAYLGYELGNAFMGYQPPIRKRILFLSAILLPILILWASPLILNDQIVIRTTFLGGTFHGVNVGPLYLPASFWILFIGVIPPVRLLRASKYRENIFLAVGFLIVLVFSLIDFVATGLNINWVRLSDFNYLPVALFFSYIQVQRFGRLYRNLDGLVHERTTELQRNAVKMAALYDTTHDLVIERELSELLHTIIERAAKLVGASGGGLYLCEPDQRQVRCVATYNTPRDYAGFVLKYGEGAAGIVAETRQPLIIDDYRVWTGRAAIYEQDQPFVSLISVPMLWQDQVIGVIHVLENTRPSAFNQEDLGIVSLFANQAALAIENTRLFQSEQRRNQETAALAEVSQDISASLQLDVVLEKIASHAKELLHAETSAVYLAEPAKHILRPIAAIGPDADEIKHSSLEMGRGILGYIAMQKNGEIVNDTATDPRAIIIEGTEWVLNEHLLGVPVISKEHLTGLIAVWRIGEDRAFKPHDLDFLNSLAGQVAVAIENARLFEETQKRLREMEGIAQVSAAISRTLELEPLLENILQSAIHAIPAARRGSILLADEEKNLRIRAVWGYSDLRVHKHVFSSDSGYSTVAFCQRRAMVIPDVRADARFRYEGDIPEMLEGGSAIAAPLIVKDLAIGVIAIDTPQLENSFNEGDLKLLEAIASSAALAIENARLFEYTQHRLAELEILQTIASALRLAQTLDEALPIIFDQLIKLLNVESASLELVDPATREIVTELACGQWAPVTGFRTPMDVGVSAHVIHTCQPYVTTNAITDGYLVRPDLVGGLTVVACVPVVAHRQPIGALWVGRQTLLPFTHEEVNSLTALGEMVGNTIQRMKLHEQTERQADEIISAYDLTLEGWAKALELRDKETEGHSRRVTNLTLQLAREFGIPEPELVHIRRGVLLHDIGKMGIPDGILLKAGPLNAEEWEIMQTHPLKAEEMLRDIPYLQTALDIPKYHHERWDGSGYPFGWVGSRIPLAARIFAIVDVFDALSSDRPYRNAWSQPAVLQYLCDQSGKHFDPQVVDVFLNLIQKKN